MIDSMSVANSIANITGIVKAFTTGLGPLLSEVATFLTVVIVGYHAIASRMRHKETMSAVKVVDATPTDAAKLPVYPLSDEQVKKMVEDYKVLSEKAKAQ